MKIEAFETEFNVEDVVWFMYNNRPVRGIVYAVEVSFKEEANLSWTYRCVNIIRKIQSYFSTHIFKKDVFYAVQRVNDDDTYNGAGNHSHMTANQLFHTKEDLLKSL